MGLVIVVVGILAQYQHAHALVGSEPQGGEDLRRGWKDGVCAALLGQKLREFKEIGLLALCVEDRLPGGRECRDRRLSHSGLLSECTVRYRWAMRQYSTKLSHPRSQF